MPVGAAPSHHILAGVGGQAEALSSHLHRGLKFTLSPCCSVCGWDLAAGVSPQTPRTRACISTSPADSAAELRVAPSSPAGRTAWVHPHSGTFPKCPGPRVSPGGRWAVRTGCFKLQQNL